MSKGLSGAGSEVVVTEETITGGVLKKQRIHLRKFLHHATNNEAEYNGVLCGMVETEKAIMNTRDSEHTWVAEIHVKGDSDLVVQQLKGTNRCRSVNLVHLHRQVISTLNNMRAIIPDVEVSFEHVYREENIVADGSCVNHVCCCQVKQFYSRPYLFLLLGLANEAMDSKRSYTTVFDEPIEWSYQDV